VADINFNLTQDLLHELFDYRDGKLFWKKVTSTRSDVIGKEVGCINSQGYKTTKIGGKNHLVHRLIYAMFYSDVPKCLDHIDGNRSNNKIENLRKATFSENMFNAKSYKTNKTGVKGVNFNKECQKFSARCAIKGKSHWLGLYKTLEEAEKVVKDFRTKHHGDFANHG